MKKSLFAYPVITAILALAALYLGNYLPSKPTRADTDTATLSTTVLEYLTFSITQEDTVAFGNLTPGTPICNSTGTVASVTTNAANGYTLGLHDGVSGIDSSMLHTDAATRIADYAGTIGTPTSWTDTGVGISLYDADNDKDAKWGTGTTVCDSNNKYAGIPETATTAHTVTGFHSGADTSSWSFQIDVPNTQKTGAYSGDVTFTATAVLS